MDKDDITGLVLAGGRGSRMGGVDKGLQPWHGRPLALHALERLAPQVGPVALNANRNLAAYAQLGAALRAPVWPDADASYAGPLAGWLAGLAHCQTPWLVTVACDTPHFPLNLVHALGAAAEREGAHIAMAVGPDTEHPAQPPRMRSQPVFSLLHASLRDDLAAYLAGGERKVERFTARHRLVLVPFEDPQAFVNLNTLDELAQPPRPRNPGAPPPGPPAPPAPRST